MASRLPRTPEALKERDEIIRQIRDAMKHLEFNQSEFSERMGMSRQVLSYRLTGTYELTLTELIRISRLLGLEIII